MNKKIVGSIDLIVDRWGFETKGDVRVNCTLTAILDNGKHFEVNCDILQSELDRIDLLNKE